MVLVTWCDPAVRVIISCKCSPPQTCHGSRVTCHVSRVMCHVSRVTCHMSKKKLYFNFFFLEHKKIGQSGGASRWRVFYQRGLPRLVSFSVGQLSIQNRIMLKVMLDTFKYLIKISTFALPL